MISEENKQLLIPSYMMITLIIGEQQCHKFINIAKENHICHGVTISGKGTVSSSVLNLLGIKSQKRIIIELLMEEEKAMEMLDYISNELKLYEQGHGLAYITRAATIGSLFCSQTGNNNPIQNTEMESMFKKLTVVVNRGNADDVMDIARKSGVKGGTILHGKGTGGDYVAKLLGMEVEPEKELIFMLLPNDLVDKVVGDLYKELKLDVSGNGILFVEPVFQVRGLYGYGEKAEEE